MPTDKIKEKSTSSEPPYCTWVKNITRFSVIFLALTTTYPALKKTSVSSKEKQIGPNSRSCKIKALLVGINYYDSQKALSGAPIKDILSTRNHLVTLCPRAEIRILSDKLGIGSVATPTRDNILKELNRMIDTIKPGEIGMFHYAGHGDQTVDLNGDEKDARDEYLVTLDDKLTDDEISAAVSKLPKGSNFLMLSDSCHSGTILDLPRTSNYSRDTYSYYHNGGELRSISGSLDDQTSTETSQGGYLTLAFWDTVNNIGLDAFFNKLFSHDIKEIVSLEASINHNMNWPTSFSIASLDRWRHKLVLYLDPELAELEGPIQESMLGARLSRAEEEYCAISDDPKPPVSDAVKLSTEYTNNNTNPEDLTTNDATQTSDKKPQGHK